MTLLNLYYEVLNTLKVKQSSVYQTLSTYFIFRVVVPSSYNIIDF